jgi:hypothetical protein
MANCPLPKKHAEGGPVNGDAAPDPEERRWVIVQLTDELLPANFVVPEIADGPRDPRAQVTRDEGIELCNSLSERSRRLHVCLHLDHEGNLRFSSGDLLARLP